MKAKLISFWDKVKIYYSYNKYKMPLIFAFIGLIMLTAFPAAHYKYWNEIFSTTSKLARFNAIASFMIMLVALIQFVNVINLIEKKSKKTELVYVIIFTVLNVVLLFLAYVYISPYFIQGLKAKYLKSIIIIITGIVFFLTANVFAFIFMGYDTKRSLNELLAETELENKVSHE